MIILLIISAYLFFISISSIICHKKQFIKYYNSPEYHFIYDNQKLKKLPWKLFENIFRTISAIFIILIISNILNIKWYWSILIYLIISYPLIMFLSPSYFRYFGYKTKPKFNLALGKYIREEVYIIDAFITFLLGVIFFIIGINL